MKMMPQGWLVYYRLNAPRSYYLPVQAIKLPLSGGWALLQPSSQASFSPTNHFCTFKSSVSLFGLSPVQISVNYYLYAGISSNIENTWNGREKGGDAACKGLFCSGNGKRVLSQLLREWYASLGVAWPASANSLTWEWMHQLWTGTRCSVLSQKWVFCNFDGSIVLKRLSLCRRQRQSARVCLCIRVPVFQSC